MTSRFLSPAAFRQSLEARLREDSLRTGVGIERVRQILVYERFLARVFNRFPDTVLLKGGFVLELRLGRARTTKDIDLRWTGDADAVFDHLVEAARTDAGDFLAFGVTLDRERPTLNAAGMRYEGHRFRVDARLAGKPYGMPFGVDVAFAEPIVGTPDEIEVGGFVRFAGIPTTRVRLYPVATHLAEKLHALTLPRPTPSSRVKDLPDLALLATIGEIDAAVLHRAIVTTFEHRATHPVPRRLPDPPEHWAKPYERMAASNDLRWRDLVAVGAAARAFLDPVLGGEREASWSPQEWRWRSRR